VYNRILTYTSAAVVFRRGYATQPDLTTYYNILT